MADTRVFCFLCRAVYVKFAAKAACGSFFVFADSSWVNCKDIYEKFLKRVRKQSERKEQRKQNERKE